MFDLLTQFGGVLALLIVHRLYILPSIARMHRDADELRRQFEALQNKLGDNEKPNGPVPESVPVEVPSTEPPHPLPIARAIRRSR